MRVLVRADASTEIGSGHVMRCLALAAALRARGAQVVFLSRLHPGHFCEHVKAQGFEVIALPLGNPTAAGPRHARWLGASLDEEVQQVNAALGSLSSWDWAVVDHYALDARAERNLRAFAQQVAVIDDLADRSHDADVLLDANLQLQPSRYEGLVPTNCRLLLGPRFALLRPAFLELRRQTPRVWPQPAVSVRRVLVSLGGGDPHNATGLVLQALQCVASENLHIDVVIGKSHPQPEQVARLCAALPRAQLYVQTDQMAALMQAADLMIGAPGISTWERCCLGLPAILIAIAHNQIDIGKGAGAERFAWFLGNAEALTIDAVASAIARMLARPSLLARLSQRGQRLVDGQGAARAAAALDRRLRLNVVSDEHSWLNRFLPPLLEGWKAAGHEVTWVHQVSALGMGDCALFLSCGQLAGAAILARNVHNVVVHESDLPRGRGWSPMTWQVLEGKACIPVTLFEAQLSVDSGPIYAQTQMQLQGHELVDELRALQAEATLRLCQWWVQNYPVAVQTAREQRGTPSTYPRRRAEDSRLDPALTLAEQFNLLRVVDNDAYPAFFDHHGVRYVLRIEKDRRSS